jgi:hypothetical protein
MKSKFIIALTADVTSVDKKSLEIGMNVTSQNQWRKNYYTVKLMNYDGTRSWLKFHCLINQNWRLCEYILRWILYNNIFLNSFKATLLLSIFLINSRGLHLSPKQKINTNYYFSLTLGKQFLNVWFYWGLHTSKKIGSKLIPFSDSKKISTLLYAKICLFDFSNSTNPSTFHWNQIQVLL